MLKTLALWVICRQARKEGRSRAVFAGHWQEGRSPRSVLVPSERGSYPAEEEEEEEEDESGVFMKQQQKDQAETGGNF